MDLLYLHWEDYDQANLLPIGRGIFLLLKSYNLNLLGVSSFHLMISTFILSQNSMYNVYVQ